MEYALLIAPHANARYMESIKPLALAELGVSFPEISANGNPRVESMGGAAFVRVKTGELDPKQRAALRSLSFCMLLCEIQNGALYPCAEDGKRYMAEDMPRILKYKGKTNESFTELLINCAASLSKTGASGVPRGIDPVCGKGTSLFSMMSMGYDSYGVEIDKKDARETLAFIKRYFEYHKYKYKSEEKSLTVGGREQGRLTAFTTAATPEAFKSGDTRELVYVLGDTLITDKLLPKTRFDFLTADLPYGVQHSGQLSGGAAGARGLLEKAAPAWKKVLRPGGCAAISFNSNTMTLREARAILADSGFAPLTGGYYENFNHWVEQAVTRDAVFAVRE